MTENIRLLNNALMMKGFNLAPELLDLIEEFREKKKLTFEQAAENLMELNRKLTLGLCKRGVITKN